MPVLTLTGSGETLTGSAASAMLRALPFRPGASAANSPTRRAWHQT